MMRLNTKKMNDAEEKKGLLSEIIPICLMYDTSPSTLFSVGFGFVPSTLDYKVVPLVDIHLDYENFDEYI